MNEEQKRENGAHGESDGTMGLMAGTGSGALAGGLIGELVGGPPGALVGAIVGGVLGAAGGEAAHHVGEDIAEESASGTVESTFDASNDASAAGAGAVTTGLIGGTATDTLYGVPLANDVYPTPTALPGGVAGALGGEMLGREREDDPTLAADNVSGDGARDDRNDHDRAETAPPPSQ